MGSVDIKTDKPNISSNPYDDNDEKEEPVDDKSKEILKVLYNIKQISDINFSLNILRFLLKIVLS